MSTKLSEDEIARSHRWHAIECNNIAWALSELSQRTPLQDAEMLNAAHASAFHWSKVGRDLNDARARLLLGHVHAALRHGEIALSYARESGRYLLEHDPPDWERAFAHAILAHAAFAAGEVQLFKQHYARALDAGEAIRDPEDKEIFVKTFKVIPRPRE